MASLMSDLMWGLHGWRVRQGRRAEIAARANAFSTTARPRESMMLMGSNFEYIVCKDKKTSILIMNEERETKKLMMMRGIY